MDIFSASKSLFKFCPITVSDFSFSLIGSSNDVACVSSYVMASVDELKSLPITLTYEDHNVSLGQS